METGGAGVGGGRPAGLILNSSSNGIHPTLAAAAEQHIIKSPSLSALEYGHVTAFVDRSSGGGGMQQQQQQQHVLLVTSRQPQSPAGQPDIVQHQISGSSTLRQDDDGDDINVLRRLPQFQLTNNYSSDYGDYATMGRGGRDILGAATGDYQSAQTDSFYPSVLWDQSSYSTQQPHQYEGLEGSNSNMLPHVPLHHHQHQQMIITNPGYVDGDAGEADTVSVDSYNLPCRIPQQQQQEQQQLDTTDYVPYPADFGLPRTGTATAQKQQSPSTSIAHHHLQQRLTTTSMASSSGASSAESIIPPPMMTGGGGGGTRMWSNNNNNINNNNRTTSSSSSLSSSSQQQQHQHAASASPVLAVTGNKIRQGPCSSSAAAAAAAGRQHPHHHLVARDSPDEGYQEECATDV